MSDYYKDRQLSMAYKVDQVIEGMPPFIKKLFNVSTTIVSEATKLQYCRTYKEFFHFLLEYEDANITRNSIVDITTEDLEQVSSNVISFYYKFLSADEIFEMRNKDVFNKLKSPKNSIDTANRKFNEIKTLFSFLVGENIITVSPTKNIRLAKPIKKQFRYAPEGTADWIIENMKLAQMDKYVVTRNIAIIRLFEYTAIRKQELVGLDIEDVTIINDAQDKPEMVNMQITRKGGDIQVLPLPLHLLKTLTDYFYIRETKKLNVGCGNPIFISEQGNRISASAIDNIFKQYSNGSVTAHDFRRGKSKSLIDNDQGKVATALLGHNVETTTLKHYYAANREDILAGMG